MAVMMNDESWKLYSNFLKYAYLNDNKWNSVSNSLNFKLLNIKKNALRVSLPNESIFLACFGHTEHWILHIPTNYSLWSNVDYCQSFHEKNKYRQVENKSNYSSYEWQPSPAMWTLRKRVPQCFSFSVQLPENKKPKKEPQCQLSVQRSVWVCFPSFQELLYFDVVALRPRRSCCDHAFCSRNPEL